jgi:UDP-N-acetylglucosamine 2-epimerase (hydrolysing)
MRKVLFITGTRADFGKLKPLIRVVKALDGFSPEIFVTGMHMLQRYGSTWEEVVWSDLAPVHPFVNQAPGDSMDVVLAKTVTGLSDYVKETLPDLIVVHGDRVEAMAGAIVGSLSNTRVAHVEGGELSGTIDEVLRHAISKLSSWHFVSNDDASNRLRQLGEDPERIFVIGSPDIDMMDSPELPTLAEALAHYQITFANFGLLIFHPVTTELEKIEDQTRTIMDSLVESGRNIIIIESNNDMGSENIRSVFSQYDEHPGFRFFPSMRFEYFLTILRNADFMIGNSSAGIREAPHFGVPTINLGSRQLNRVVSSMVDNVHIARADILAAIGATAGVPRVPEHNFGDGRSSERFKEIISRTAVWDIPIQKQFKDIPTQRKES